IAGPLARAVAGGLPGITRLLGCATALLPAPPSMAWSRQLWPPDCMTILRSAADSAWPLDIPPSCSTTSITPALADCATAQPSAAAGIIAILPLPLLRRCCFESLARHATGCHAEWLVI